MAQAALTAPVRLTPVAWLRKWHSHWRAGYTRCTRLQWVMACGLGRGVWAGEGAGGRSYPAIGLGLVRDRKGGRRVADAARRRLGLWGEAPQKGSIYSGLADPPPRRIPDGLAKSPYEESRRVWDWDGGGLCLTIYMYLIREILIPLNLEFSTRCGVGSG